MRLSHLITLVLALVVTGGCAAPESTPEPTVTPTPVSIPVYIAEVVTTLDFIRDTLKVAGDASQSLADDKITRQEYKEMAVAGKRNLETAENKMGSMIPPPESAGPASFEELHKYLMLGIKWYKKAFDEMIEYGNDGRLSHIQNATNYIENHGDPYINTVKIELRILEKEFLK